jgi:hypothetical protein
MDKQSPIPIHNIEYVNFALGAFVINFLIWLALISPRHLDHSYTNEMRRRLLFADHSNSILENSLVRPSQHPHSSTMEISNPLQQSGHTAKEPWKLSLATTAPKLSQEAQTAAWRIAIKFTNAGPLWPSGDSTTTLSPNRQAASTSATTSG